MRYRVRHTTSYAYGTPVELAAHMVHLRPRPRPWQTVLSERITTAPTPARRRDGLDHFGNHVTWLFMDLPHADFEVTSHAVVDVDCPPPPAAQDTLPWEDVAQATHTPEGWQAAEFRFGTAMAPIDAEAKAYVSQSFTRGRPVLAALLELNNRFFTEFRFRAGVTSIATPVAQIMRQREGVCQDFSHALISGLRGIGLPARYTSGYIRTKPPPGQVKRQGADQSHAWVGCWLGPEHGWVDIDPTNGIVVKDEHVVLGWGRDFSDISPVRGVILGGGDHVVRVGVDLEPMDAGDAV
ncbi:transglutaminase family protein [Acidisphaera sp. S103]|uniref:transglutaminase family protein n=1 Tax=Acidisphaera sp. S103 TaxID=1747223 RepID=UPI00131EC16A|nr:transglutaminase family protein [Acidisphaera sp. S103]